jgi:hypothetical protein
MHVETKRVKLKDRNYASVTLQIKLQTITEINGASTLKENHI